jgi:Ca2+-binding RTX toxin-like protein
MTFSLTAAKSSVSSQEDKISSLEYQRLFEDFLKCNPSWLEDKGFGGIQAQVITSSTTFPELEFSDPGKARAFDFWFGNLAGDSGAVADSGKGAGAEEMPVAPSTGGIDPVPCDFTPERCMPIYWEETVSDPIDLYAKDGTKIGHKVVTTGAGYTTTNYYDLEGALTKTEYESMFGDWSETRYEPITKDGETFILTKSSGKSGDYSWTSSQLSDAKNNLLESGYEDSSGYKSSTKQEYKKSEDGSIVKIIVFSEGAGGGYEYSSSAEYDANWNVIKSSYKDSNGYSSSTERVALGNIDSTFEGYSVISKGAGPNGYSYESLETFDKSGNLVKNSYKDSSGYYSQRTTENQVDPIWGTVIITKDITGNDQQSDAIAYKSTATYTSDWRLIASEHEDSYGYSSKLTTRIETSPTGEKLYVQTYQFTYPGGSTSEWVTQYNGNWWPIVDGKPVEQFPVLYKMPVVTGAPEPEVVPVVERSAVADFQEKVSSASDVVSDQVITGVKGQSDKLTGTDDDDVFMVNDKADRLVTGQKGASDSVMTQDFSLSLRLKTWDGIENAMLVGSADLNLTGDTGPNVLSGNGGNNILGGAAGADTLFGGGGADTFVVTNDKTFDQIIDFVSGEDKIALSGRAFRSLFISGNQLKDGVFGEKLKLDVDGGLWFDSDGSGRKAAVKIATIGITASLEMDDFVFLA